MKFLNFKTAIITLLILLNWACHTGNSIDLNDLNGYWEIKTVTLESGEVKTYNFNDTIDFISLTDSLTGFRKKLKPTLDGVFETSNDMEQFEIKKEHDSINMYYQTPYVSWKETILMVSENTFKIVNKNGIIYEYQRYKPINLD